MTMRRPNWLTIVLSRGLFGLPGFSLTRFLLSFVLWSAVAVAVVLRDARAPSGQHGVIESADHVIWFRQPPCASRSRPSFRSASNLH